MSLFGSSGIRGVVGRDFTVDLAVRIGTAVGNLYRRVVVGKDTRTSGDMITSALASGVNSVGGDVYMAGMLPTPTLAKAASRFDCGLMVTASHNPPEYNGVKMWNPDGSSFGSEQMQEMESLIRREGYDTPDWRGVGKVYVHEGAIENHIDSILRDIGQCQSRVVVDCGCGAASVVTPLLLRRMGCTVVSLNSHPDGFFPGRSPEPTEDQLGVLKETVVRSGADIGLAHDGDGDRVVAVDDRGRFVSGDRLLALFASTAGKRGMVAPIDASMMLDDLVRGPVVRTRVGDVYVSEALKESGLEFGGEPSGTFVFARRSYCPDGIYAAALLTRIASGNRLSSLIDSLPSYPSVRESFSFDGTKRGEVEGRIETEFKRMECSRVLTMDGYRAEFPDGWFLVRLSGTEPKMRMTVEARSREALEKLSDMSRSIVMRCLE